MSSKVLSCKEIPELSPVTTLWKLAEERSRKFAFTAKTRSEAEAWQEACTAALSDAVGFQDLPAVDPAPQIIEEVERPDHIRRKILLNTTPVSKQLVYLLTPKNAAGKLPCVLAFHGHGYGVKDIVGLWEDGEERYTPDGGHAHFAIEICRRGFMVAAPEIACFGERVEDFSYVDKPEQAPPTTCHLATSMAMMLGGSMIGFRVLEAKRLVDYLKTLSEADVSRLGAMGISGGGLHTFFSTCLDRRIKAAVVSGYFSTFRDSILSVNHCTCNYAPNLLNVGEMYDLVGLIAPRPILIESGERDPIFPIEAVKSSVETTRKIYRIFGAENEVETDLFEGRHRISGLKAYDWLKEKLGE
jgi:dienelactone hydrolase